MCTWYQASASLRTNFHHVSAVADKSETPGSISSNQSVSCKGACVELHSGGAGKS